MVICFSELQTFFRPRPGGGHMKLSWCQGGAHLVLESCWAVSQTSTRSTNSWLTSRPTAAKIERKQLNVTVRCSRHCSSTCISLTVLWNCHCLFVAAVVVVVFFFVIVVL